MSWKNHGFYQSIFHRNKFRFFAPQHSEDRGKKLGKSWETTESNDGNPSNFCGRPDSKRRRFISNFGRLFWKEGLIHATDSRRVDYKRLYRSWAGQGYNSQCYYVSKHSKAKLTLHHNIGTWFKMFSSLLFMPGCPRLHGRRKFGLLLWFFKTSNRKTSALLCRAFYNFSHSFPICLSFDLFVNKMFNPPIHFHLTKTQCVCDFRLFFIVNNKYDILIWFQANFSKVSSDQLFAYQSF